MDMPIKICILKGCFLFAGRAALPFASKSRINNRNMSARSYQEREKNTNGDVITRSLRKDYPSFAAASAFISHTMFRPRVRIVVSHI